MYCLTDIILQLKYILTILSLKFYVECVQLLNCTPAQCTRRHEPQMQLLCLSLLLILNNIKIFN